MILNSGRTKELELVYRTLSEPVFADAVVVWQCLEASYEEFKCWAGGISWWLRGLNALAEDMGSVSSTHIVSNNYLSHQFQKI